MSVSAITSFAFVMTASFSSSLAISKVALVFPFIWMAILMVASFVFSSSKAFYPECYRRVRIAIIFSIFAVSSGVACLRSTSTIAFISSSENDTFFSCPRFATAIRNFSENGASPSFFDENDAPGTRNDGCPSSEDSPGPGGFNMMNMLMNMLTPEQKQMYRKRSCHYKGKRSDSR